MFLVQKVGRHDSESHEIGISENPRIALLHTYLAAEHTRVTVLRSALIVRTLVVGFHPIVPPLTDFGKAAPNLNSSTEFVSNLVYVIRSGS
jgi:hypothetical protein